MNRTAVIEVGLFLVGVLGVAATVLLKLHGG